MLGVMEPASRHRWRWWAGRALVILWGLPSLFGALDLPAGYPTWYRCVRYGAKHCDSIKAAMPVNPADLFHRWDLGRLVYLCGFVLALALLFPASVWRRVSKLVGRKSDLLSLEFSLVPIGDEGIIVCRIFNRPDSGKTAHEVSASGEVVDHDTKHFVAAFDRTRLERAVIGGEPYMPGPPPTGYRHPDLEPSEFPLLLAIARFYREGKFVMWAGERAELTVPGRYRIAVTVRCHEGSMNGAAVFTVTGTGLRTVNRSPWARGDST
jgi:hypothetical protein